MKNLKQIQEFFSKPLNEGKPLAENTFKKGDKVTYLGHPAIVTATKEYNGRNFVSVSYDKGTGKTKASNVLVTSGDVKAVNEMDINDPIAEMKVGDKVTFKSGGDDMEIIGVRDMFASDLKAYRVKNADGETFEYSEDQLQLAETYASSFGGFRKELDGETIENEGKSKEERLKVAFDALDKAEMSGDIRGVELALAAIDSIRGASVFESIIDENKMLKQAKLSSAEYQKAKKLKDFNKDDYKWNPGESLYIKLNESVAQTLAETIKLGEGVIEEELCPKGKAYIKRRKAAGEKSSAYLSGRAVKVCKGQMSGRKK